MGRRRTKPHYLVVHADLLGSIGKDRVFIPDSDPEESLIDELQCPLFDEILIALRKAFSLSYPHNPFIDGLQAALMEIRRVGVEALQFMPEVVEELKLKRLPPAEHESARPKAYVFQYCLARYEDIQLSVKYEGKSRKLIGLVDERSADETIRTLRDVISDTFEEMYNEDQHEEVLQRIRERIGAVLPQFNDILVDIEVEPIADMSVFDKPDLEKHDPSE